LKSITEEIGYVATLILISLTAAMTLVPAYTTIPAFPDPTAELSAHQGARPPILAFAGEPRTSLALERAYPVFPEDLHPVLR